MHNRTWFQSQAEQVVRDALVVAKKAALVIEDSLARVATQYMKLLQQHDATHYTDDKGNKFVLEQFTKDYTVKVDAHSNSPIFMEDLRSLAFNLYKAQAIDKESLIDMLDPPMKQMLKEKLKKAEKAKALQPPAPPPEGKKG